MSNKPKSFGSTNSAKGVFDIGDFLKAIQGTSVIGGRDFTGVTLSYTKSVGSQLVQVPITTAKEFNTAVQQFAAEYPGAGALLNNYFQLGPGATSKQVNAAWQSVEDANYNLAKAQNPVIASATATITNLENVINKQQAAGTSSATASQQANAIDNIGNTIESWNYNQAQKDFLNSVVTKLVTVNGDHIVNQNALLDIIRGEKPSGLGAKVDAEIKADYTNAFPGLASYNSQPGAIHMSETQYNTYTQSIMNSATQYGAPMPTQEQIGALLNGHVSAAEYQQRITDVYAQVSNADQNTKNILEREYGIGPNQLMSYFMDPKNSLPTMQRQVASAEIQDYASRVGLTGLSASGANQLADMAKLSSTTGNQVLGYGVSNIESSLLNASKDVALTTSAPGAAQPTINTNTLIGSQLAGFGGTNQVAAQTEVERAEQAKAAPFEKGGGYAESQKGVIGLGSART